MDLALRFAVNGRYWLGGIGINNTPYKSSTVTYWSSCMSPPGGLFSLLVLVWEENTARDGVMRKREMGGRALQN